MVMLTLVGLPVMLTLIHVVPQRPSRRSRLCVKYVPRWLRSPGQCWTVAMLTSCYGRLALRCSAALAAATPRVYSAPLLSHTPDTYRYNKYIHTNMYDMKYMNHNTHVWTKQKQSLRCVFDTIFPLDLLELLDLQVMKIEYVNKRPTYAKAVVSVVDHVECRCQPAPRPPVSKKKSSRRQHGHLHRNQTLSQEHGQVQCERYCC